MEVMEELRQTTDFAAYDRATCERCNYRSNATFDFNLVILKMQCGLFKGVLTYGCG
jgi:hypothetical protein